MPKNLVRRVHIHVFTDQTTFVAYADAIETTHVFHGWGETIRQACTTLINECLLNDVTTVVVSDYVVPMSQGATPINVSLFVANGAEKIAHWANGGE